MKIVIFGSRGIEDIGMVEGAMEVCGMAANVTEIVSGGARGADMLGERYAGSAAFPARYSPRSGQNTATAPGFSGTWKWRGMRTMAWRYGTE
jgi:hypothetical protein